MSLYIYVYLYTGKKEHGIMGWVLPYIFFLFKKKRKIERKEKCFKKNGKKK